MTSTPLVSIVIPTYDRPELFGLALRSAVEQTYERLDIFVADDGTNPETEAVLREIAGDDPRVRYERNETNLGNYGNGQKVLRAARGDFIKMLLDDDLLAPTHVESLLAPMLDSETLTMAFCKRTVIDRAGTPQPDPPGMSALAAAAGVIAGEVLVRLCTDTLMNWIGELSCVLMRRRAMSTSIPFRLAGGRATDMLADLTLWLSLLAKGDAWYTPEPLASFRQHAGQVSERPHVHLSSLVDWVMIQQHAHLVRDLSPRDDRLTTFARLIGALAGRIAATPDLPEAADAHHALATATRHFGELREHGRILDAPRVSIILVARGDAPGLLPQLEAIIESTPSDAYDVVIAAVDPTPAIRSLLDSLGGEVQVLDVDPSGDPWTVAAAAARYECVLLVAPGVCPTHGWHVGLLDALAGTDTDSEPAAVAAVRIDDAQYRDVTIVAAPPTDCILAHRASVAGWRIDDDKLAAAARDAGGAILAHPASRVHVAG